MRKLIRKLILREFRDGTLIGNNDFDISSFLDDNDDPPTPNDNDRGDGGGRREIHQLIKQDARKSSDDPNSYIAFKVDMSPGSDFDIMSKNYEMLSDYAKAELYSYTAEELSNEDRIHAKVLKKHFLKLLNSWTLDVAEYFTIFHPSYSIDAPVDIEKMLGIYKAVTGYMPDIERLSYYELVMHSASTLL